MERGAFSKHIFVENLGLGGKLEENLENLESEYYSVGGVLEKGAFSRQEMEFLPLVRLD